MHKMNKKLLEKSSNNAKMSHFENSIFSSKRVQIGFWVVEKIPMAQMNPNPKYSRNSYIQFLIISKYREKVSFFTVFEKAKKRILGNIFWRRGRMNILIRGKKTCDPRRSSPQISFKSSYYWKNIDILDCNIFFASQYWLILCQDTKL